MGLIGQALYYDILARYKGLSCEAFSSSLCCIAIALSKLVLSYDITIACLIAVDPTGRALGLLLLLLDGNRPGFFRLVSRQYGLIAIGLAG